MRKLIIQECWYVEKSSILSGNEAETDYEFPGTDSFPMINLDNILIPQ